MSESAKHPQDIYERTKAFALRIIKLYSDLPKTAEVRIFGKQSLRSGASGGVHLREGRRSRSNAENFKTNPRGGGVAFTRDALKRYFAEYERFISKEFDHPDDQTRTTLRKSIRRQAEKLAAVVQHNEAYIPFELKL